MLYKIIPDPSRSNYDPRQNIGPHVDGIVGFASVKSTNLMTRHLKELSLNRSTGGPNSSVSSSPTQLEYVHYVKASTNPNGNQQPGKNKKKGNNNNHKGGENNNKPKDNGNNERTNNNASEGKKERCKVKFPYKLCIDNHLTHLCTKIVKPGRLLPLPPAMLTNHFPHNQHMALSSSNAENVVDGIQNPLTQDDDHLCINMVNSQVNVATWPCDYSSSQTLPGLESPTPPKTPL
jgi:hypothetical protein